MFDEARLSLLRCPDCPGHPLELPAGLPGEGGFVSGELSCAGCGRSFEIRESVPRLMPRALERGEGSDEVAGERWDNWDGRLHAFLRWRREQGEEEDAERRRAAREEAQRLRDLFVDFCALPAGRAVEIGCGHGSLRTSLRWNPEAEYWGVDPVVVESPACRFPLVQGVGEHLPLAEGSFEAVLVKESFNHFNDLPAFLREARRILRPGGRLLVMDAAEDTWSPESDSPSLPAHAGRALRRLLSGDLRGLSRALGRRLRRERRLEAGEVRVHHLGAASMVELIREHLAEVVERRSGDHVLLSARRGGGPPEQGVPRSAP